MIVKIGLINPINREEAEEKVITMNYIPRKGEHFFIDTKNGERKTFLVIDIMNYYKETEIIGVVPDVPVNYVRIIAENIKPLDA